MSSLEYVGELVASVPTSANVKYYANIVKEKATLRRLIKVTEGIANQCYLDRDSLDEIMAGTEREVFSLLQNRAGFQDQRECNRDCHRLYGPGLPHLWAAAFGFGADCGKALHGQDGLRLEYRPICGLPQ